MKKILNSTEAKEALLEGVSTVADMVSETIGPGGRVVFLAGRYLVPTKDGVSVAREISLPSPQGYGARLCIMVASKANSEVGDGTSASCVLAKALTKWALEQKGTPREVKQQLQDEAARVCAFVQQHARQVSIGEPLLQHIGEISGNSYEVGKLVADAWSQIGPSGIITCTVAPRTNLSVEPGFRIDKGLVDPRFINDATTASWVAQDPQVVLVAGTISYAEHLVSILNLLDQKKPILLVADVEGDALATAIQNANKNINIGIVGIPGVGIARQQNLEDLAALTGARVLDAAHQTIGAQKNDFTGTCKAVKSTQWATILLTDPCPEDYLSQLQATAAGSPDYLRDPINERIARLTSGVAVIGCGGATEAEAFELRDRVEDAIKATRAALDKGIVPGAGWCLANANSIPPYQTTREIILRNAGYSCDDITKVLDCRTGEIVDPFEAGVVDPVSVVITAVETATSIASLIVDCGGLVYQDAD